MTSPTDATQKLRGRYADGLPAKWHVIEEAVASLEAGDADAEPTLRRVATQVRSAAASQGFVAIDKAAFMVEQAEDRAALTLASLGLIRAMREAHAAESIDASRILLIDDDPEIGFIVRALLADERLDITQVMTAAAARDELARPWDLIFVDLVLPDADGRTLITQVRSYSHHVDALVVVLSAKTSSLVKNECAVYGVDDFIEKPIDPATFAVQVAALLQRARAQQPMTLDDAITGLPNRLGFRRTLERLVARQRSPITIAVLDIEHFAVLVERRGQAEADRAVVLVAKLLREALTKDAVIGRWGGSEFLVALPGVHAIEAIALLERASESVRRLRLEADASLTLALSAGVTELDARENLDFALLRADQLLHRAKQSGRDKWYADSFAPSDDARPRLLIAEDDPASAGLLMRDLSEEYDVTYVADGDVALETAAAADPPFDLVLLDREMPRVGGVEVIRGLRALPAYAKRPILMLTEIGSDADVEAAFAAGADDYVNKPHRRRTLLARLSRLLGRAPDADHHAHPEVGAVDTEITAMFCDISDFTAIAESMRPREILDLLNNYFPIIADIVARRGGTLEKYIGDAVLAIWGAPEAGEDDVVQALASAVEIQRAVREFGRERELALEVHIGLDSGPAVAANIGGDDSGQYAAVGNTTNIASRICDRAEPGEIIMSQASVTALAGRSTWPLGEPEVVALEGRSEPVTVYRVDWDRAGSES